MLSGIIPTHSRLVRLSHVLDRQSRLGYGTLFWRCMFEQMGPGWFASARLTFEIMEQGTGAFGVLMIWCNTARHGAIYIEGAQAAYHGYLGWLLGAWRDFWLWEIKGSHGCSTVHIYLSLFIRVVSWQVSGWRFFAGRLCIILEGHNTLYNIPPGPAMYPRLAL